MSKRMLVCAGVLAVALVGIAAFGAASVAQEEKEPAIIVKITEAKQNVMHDEIWGSWVVDEDLTKHVAGEMPKDMGGVTLTFSRDADSVKKLEANLGNWLTDRDDDSEADLKAACADIHLAGKATMTRGEDSNDAIFCIVSMHGNTYLVIAPDTEDGTPRIECVPAALVPDPVGDNDLLFVRSNKNEGEPYFAWKRAAK